MIAEELTTIVRESGDGVLVSCMLQPRASRNEVVGIYGEMLKIKLTAPPVDGKANAALRKYFSKLIKVPASSVTIVAGLTSRRKTVLLSGVKAENIIEKIIKVVK
jgi:uncharacterized protein